MAGPEVAVIGAGIAGAAAAASLARRGAKVRIFDRFAFGHAQGASHGPTRLFRTAYFEHPDYVPLLRRAHEGWRTLEREAGETLYVETGVLEAGPPEGFLVGGTRRAAAEHGLALENLTRRETQERFSWLALSAGAEALIEPQAGFLYADRCITALLAAAQRHNALFHPEERALGWAPRDRELRIRTDKGEYSADRVIICAGPWASELLRDAAPVAAMQKALFWVGAGEAALHLDTGFTPFAVETDDARMFYGFPAIDGDGLKAGEHTGGARLPAPEARSGAPGEAERNDFLEFLSRYAPGLPRKITQEKTCLYEMSPDADFIIGALAGEPRVAFAAGLSGHGFKFAPVIGEALADLAMGRPLSREFAFLAPGRLG